MNRRLPVLCALTVSGVTATGLLLSNSHPSPTQAAPPLQSPGARLGQKKLSLPTPPQQGAAWTPPSGQNAAGISSELLSATETLFRQGFPDPRGCEYRTIMVQVGNVWGGNSQTIEAHGWVLPGGKAGAQFAVCWNGLIYPVVTVKNRADLKADIRASLKKYTELVRKSDGSPIFWRSATPEAQSISTEFPTLAKVILLLRLGEYDLAREIYNLCWVRTQPGVEKNDPTLRDPYLQLAEKWAWAIYDRAVCAHMRGADRLAVADTDLLTRIQQPIEAEANRRGYQKPLRYEDSGKEVRGPYLVFLLNLPALHQDSLRRLDTTPHPPLDLKALKQLPQPQRIAELIGRLDDVAARQMGQPGGVSLDDDPVTSALIAEGEAAVEPLLDVIEKDKRLTRSVSFHRDFFTHRELQTVRSAAFTCFVRITKVYRTGDGTPTVASLRAWWAANKTSSPADRWFTQLADNGTPLAPAPQESPEAQEKREREESSRANTRRQRWEEAATSLLQRSDVETSGGWTVIPDRVTGRPLPPFKGESLRARKNPSVSDLFRERALQLSEPTEGRWGFDYASGADFALMLYEWDPQGADTLPTLRETMRRCREFQKRDSREDSEDQYQLSGRIARLTVARLRLDDTAAVTEYGAWVRTVSPRFLGFETLSALFTLRLEAARPEIRNLAKDLFSEGADVEKTAWNRLLSDPKDLSNSLAADLMSSDLLYLAPFRDLVQRRLTNRAEAGWAIRKKGDDPEQPLLVWLDANVVRPTPSKNGSEQRVSLRICDRVALSLQRLYGVPNFDPFAPVAERDRQCNAITAYLRRYGTILGRLRPQDIPLYSHEDVMSLDYLGPAYRSLSAPATAADVEAGRALFTLNDPRARLAPNLTPLFPLEASWKRDPYPNFATRSNGKKIPISHGYIWQAEEIFDGKRWVRYYGFIGRHSVTRVPAAEVEITDYRLQPKPAAKSTSP